MRKTAFLMAVLILILSISGCSKQNSAKEGQREDFQYSWALQDSSRIYGEVFGDNEIINVSVNLSEDDWSDLCENATNETYYSADIEVNGVKLDNVGFRTKGFSSLTSVANSDSDRYGFKIKTNEFVKGQTLNGLDMFVLNGSFSDSSYMREYLTYSANEQLGLMTPFVSYVNLYINGDLFGFYLMIEAYDDSFVERHTSDEEAVLYKADSENCTLAATDNCEGFDVKYGTDEGNQNVKKLVSALNCGDTEQLENIFDVDSALKSWAVNTVLGNYDSYSGSKAHNYYLLYADGKFTYIGWDYNMSIGGFGEDNGSSVTVDIDNPIYNVQENTRPLIENLLGVDEYKQKYLGYVEQLCDYFGNIEQIVSWINDKISDCVKNDPTAFYTYNEYTAGITKSNTDLTEKSGNIPGGNFDFNDITMPGDMTMPDGFDPGQNGGGGLNPGQGMNPGGEMNPGEQMLPGEGNGIGGQMIPGGEAESGINPGGDMPFNPGDIPEGGIPEGSIPEGNIPGGNIPYGQQFGMLTTQCVSVVDYILQRIANIESQ